MAHWHIVGVGAIGCLWAHRLSNAGNTVSLILKDRQQLTHYEAAEGIQLQANDSVVTRYFSASLANKVNQPIERLLVCCKSWQSLAVLNSLLPALNTNSQVVLLQNGLSQLYQSKPLLNHCGYYCASTTDGVFKHDHFSVTLAGTGSTVVGPFNSLAKQRAIALHGAQWQDDIEALLWRKLCVNAVINPLTALYDIANGELLTTQAYVKMIGPLCDEISSIAVAAGQVLTAEKILQTVCKVAQQTATNSSSMRADIRTGRRTEILEINGYLSQLAHTNGIAAPLTNELITAIIKKSPATQPPQPTT